MGAAVVLSVPFAPAEAAQALPPRCSVEPSGFNAVEGSCPSGFYWVTAHCKDVRWSHQNWHQRGDAADRPSMVSSCALGQVRVGGEVFNATTGERTTFGRVS